MKSHANLICNDRHPAWSRHRGADCPGRSAKTQAGRGTCQGPFTIGSTIWREPGMWQFSTRWATRRTRARQLARPNGFSTAVSSSKSTRVDSRVNLSRCIQLLGYDNARKKTIEIMMDNWSTSVMHNEGSISQDGRVITNIGESHRSRDRKALQTPHGHDHR